MLMNSLIELDRAHLIHPVASYRGHEKAGVRVLASGKGATVVDSGGHELVDGFAGLWCVNAGYGQEKIIEAATRQLRELPYATGYFGLGSEPAIRLASELADRTPGDLNHVYFTLGGSDAVDSTVRFIRYYYHALGKPQKDQFISVDAGLSRLLNGRGGPHRAASLPCRLRAALRLAAQDSLALQLPQPGRLRPGDDHRGLGRGAACQGGGAGPRARRGLLCRADPRVGRRAGAPRRLGQSDARDLPRARGPVRRRRGHHRFRAHGPALRLLRRGHRARPDDRGQGADLGYSPMGAVFLSDRVYQTIADGAGAAAVGHGYTYSAHPVSAAVGLACLDLYENGLLENGRRAGQRLMAGLHALADHPLVGQVRGRGMLAAIELVTDKARKTPLPAAAEPARRVFDRAWDNGLVVRAFPAGVLGYAPPLCCTDEDIDRIIDRTRLTLDQTLEDPDVRAVMKG